MSARAKQLVCRLALTSIFLGVGVLHFVAADRFLRMMPPYLSAPRELVLVSGVFEILGALGIWAPWQKLRRLAGYGLVALLTSVYIVNIDMAMHGSPLRDGTVVPPAVVVVLWLRLPLQLVMMWMAMYATRELTPTIAPVAPRRDGGSVPPPVPRAVSVIPPPSIPPPRIVGPSLPPAFDPAYDMDLPEPLPPPTRLPSLDEREVVLDHLDEVVDPEPE